MDDEWVTISEAARRHGVSRTAIQRWIKSGRVEHRLDNRGNPQVRCTVQHGPVQGTSAPPALPVSTEIPATAAPLDEMISLAAHREALEAVQRATDRLVAELSTALHRQVAAERRRADAVENSLSEAEQHLAFERSRGLTALERLTGRRATVSPPPAWPRRSRD